MSDMNKATSFKILLMGGLGNQFFQIARAIELRDNASNIEVIYISEELDWLYRLGGHTKHDKWFDISILAENLNLKYRRIKFIELLSLGFKFIGRKIGLFSTFDEELEKKLHHKSLKSGTWDIGYFQSKKHVSLNSVNKVSQGLIKLLGIDEVKASSRFAFHIRGGDFKSVDRVTTDDIQIAIGSTIVDSAQIFVATNDIKFSSDIFECLDVDFEISNLPPKADFIALATAKNIFVSNSSFAFWAALCAKNLYNSDVYSLHNWPYKDFLVTLLPEV